jgi:hypothetical protein
LIAFPASQTYQPRPVSGWILDILVACDAIYPCVLRRYLTASPLRRQCISLALSAICLDHPQALADRLLRLDGGQEGQSRHPLAIIARILLHRRVRDIVRALHPEAIGLVRTLGKLGFDPLGVADYRLLSDLHTQPKHRSRALLLRHAARIPRRAIRILMALEAPYICLPLLKRLGSVEQVSDFQRSIELIKRVVPDVTDEELVASLQALKPDIGLGNWVQQHWLLRSTTFWTSSPVKDDAELVSLHSAAAMRDASRRFQNCLSGKIGFCALGRTLYLEYLPKPAIIELQVLDRGYLLETLYGPQNATVDPQTTSAIVRKLRAAGVLVPARLAQAARYNPVARLASILDFSRDDLTLIDDDISDLELGLADAA